MWMLILGNVFSTERIRIFDFALLTTATYGAPRCKSEVLCGLHHGQR